MSVGGNKLTKNFSEWAIFSIINNTKLNDRTLVAWRLIGGKKVTVNVKIRVLRKFRSEIVLKTEDVRSQAMLQDLTAGTDKLNFYLQQEMVLFQTMIKSRSAEGEITVTIPNMIAQIDRRKHLRLFVEDYMPIQVNFIKKSNLNGNVTQQFDKKCYDLSAGGFSFVISKTEAKFFKIGDPVLNVSLNMDGQFIYFNAKIVNLLNVEPNELNKLNYKGLKVCLKFLDLAQKYHDVINDYVFKNVDFSQNVV